MHSQQGGVPAPTTEGSIKGLLESKESPSCSRSVPASVPGRPPVTARRCWPWSPAKGTAAVASAVAREQSFKGAFIKLVDGFYELFLARQADSGGESYWVNLLAGGATEEQVMEGFVTVPEFAQRNVLLSTTNNSDAGFVQALYSVLLHRSLASGNLTQADINAGVSLLAMKGRAGLAADFLTGSDFQTADGSTFRQAAVRSFYGDPTLSPLPFEFFLPNLLHRPAAPAAIEVAFWANSSLDLFSIETGIAGAPENFSNG